MDSVALVGFAFYTENLLSANLRLSIVRHHLVEKKQGLVAPKLVFTLTTNPLPDCV